MTTSTLGITQVASNQNSKEVTINDADQQLENLTNLTVAVPIAGTTLFDLATYRSGIRFDLTDNGVAAAFNLQLPAAERLFIVRNSSTQTATIGVDPAADGFDGTTVTLLDGQTAIIICDGTNCEIVQLGGSGAQVDSWEAVFLTGTAETLQPEHAGKVVILTNASAITLTVEDNATVDIPVGKWVRIVQGGAGAVTVTGSGAAINSQGALTDLNGTWAGATLWHYSLDNWHLEGNLV